MNGRTVAEAAAHKGPAHIQVFGAALFFNKSLGTQEPPQVLAQGVGPFVARVDDGAKRYMIFPGDKPHHQVKRGFVEPEISLVQIHKLIHGQIAQQQRPIAAAQVGEATTVGF